jgi:COMPASS component SWD2
VWHIESQREVAVWSGHAGVPGCLRMHPRRLMVASACSALVLWVPNLALLEQAGHPGMVR